MKHCLILCALTTSVFATPLIQPRVTAEQLAKRQLASPMPKMEQPTAEVVTVKRPSDQSIVKQSTILHDGKNWTLVPTGAVIFLPQAMQSRVNAKPVGTLLPFPEFLAQNRAWLTTNEVSFDQASGTEGLPEERVRFWSKQDKVVIAIHQSGPISVRVAPQKPTALTKR
jgi:hypothetical protein